MFAFPKAPSGPSQQPRYRKLIKQLLMNTIVLKGTRHEMRMGPSTTISEKMIFVSPERLPSPAAQLTKRDRYLHVRVGGARQDAEKKSAAVRYR